MAVLNIRGETSDGWMEYISRSYARARDGITLAWPDEWNMTTTSPTMRIGQRRTGNGNPLNPFMYHVRQGYLDFIVPDLDGAVVTSAELVFVSAASGVGVDSIIEVRDYVAETTWGPSLSEDDWLSPTAGDFEAEYPLLATYNTADGLTFGGEMVFTSVDLATQIVEGHNYWFVSTDRIRLGDAPPPSDQLDVYSGDHVDPSLRPLLRITSEDPLPEDPEPTVIGGLARAKFATPAVVVISPAGKPVYL